MIYLDNGATSFPKPREVGEAVYEAINDYCANPGRAGHFQAARTAREVFSARMAVAELFDIDNPERIVFTKNCTEGINIALTGILKPGDHVITSSMEHNSVLRPLQRLKRTGVDVTIVKCDRAGRLYPEHVKRAIKPETKMIVLTAASNVTGTIMPLQEVGRMALRHGVLFMVDAAQGAGHFDIDVKKNNIDILAAPGHKGLLGPQGTGFLYVRKGVDVTPMLSGGTGSASHSLEQPAEFPEGYEAGTLNCPGIIGLRAALCVISRIGIPAIQNHEEKMTQKLLNGLSRIDGVQLYGPDLTEKRAPVAAFNISGMDCEKCASLLNDRYEIAVRAGFHCSGKAHDTIGTGKGGCVRMCPGFYTTEKDIEKTVAAVAGIAKERTEASVKCL